MNNIVAALSRMLFAFVMLVFAFNNFTHASMMADIVPSYLPFPELWVYINGACLTLAAISFIINRKIKLAGYLLGCLLLIFVFTIHLPYTLQTGDMNMILKDTGLAAASFFIGSKS